MLKTFGLKSRVLFQNENAAVIKVYEVDLCQVLRAEDDSGGSGDDRGDNSRP